MLEAGRRTEGELCEKLNTAANFLSLEEICSIYIMGRPLFLYVFLFYWHFLNALFTVEAPQSLCIVEHGNNVTMECTFPVNGKLEFRDLSVSWEKKDELKQVYVLHKGEEDFKSQHIDFRGRIKLLKENLNLGQSLLQITDVKLRDAGVYRCVIAYGGADYKTIHLKVKAPYRIINQGVVSTGRNEWKLTCQSEGYPKAEVIWQNRNYEDLTDKANTRFETASDQLYHVTSTLTIKSGIDEIFYCIFWNKELQENTTAILHTADSTDGILQTESRRFVGATLIATAFVGSVLLFLLCIRKGWVGERGSYGNVLREVLISLTGLQLKQIRATEHLWQVHQQQSCQKIRIRMTTEMLLLKIES